MKKERSIKSTTLASVSIGVLTLLITAAPTLADVVSPGWTSSTNTCGAVGGASMSIMLAVAGCWMVRSHWRNRD